MSVESVAYRQHFRHWSKQTLERVLLGGAGVARLGRGWRKDTIVFAYHNIVPDGGTAAGEQSLHLPQRAFAAQLDVLCRTHEVIPLAEVLRAQRVGAGRPRAVITFDDAYRGAVTAGVEELAERQLPATIFVAPAFIPGRTFWWDVYAHDGLLSTDLRQIALSEHEGRDGRVRAWAQRSGLGEVELPAHAHAASREELTAAAAVPGITLGSHTWSHCNLARVRLGDAEHELRASKAWLEERYDSAVPWLSYPYGSSTPEVEAVASELGFVGAVRIEGGWVRSGWKRPFALPRLNVASGLSG
ncbi:MAG: polysaccharide deacetylase family protein, partial [Longimicrobiales bacterium]